MRFPADLVAGEVLDYAYDDAFNLTSDSRTGACTYGGAHTLDEEGRVRRIDLADGAGSEVLTYTYAGSLARRVTTPAAGPVREVLTPDRLVRIEDGQLVLQFSDGGRVVAREQGGITSWLHYDHLNSLVLMTDAAGAELLRLHMTPTGRC